MTRHGLTLLAVTSLATAQDKVTFDDHVFPVFQQSCLNCHNPDKTKGGLDLSSYAGAMKGSSGGKIAEPGDPSSTLIKVVAQTADPKMPPEGEKLPSEQLQILKRWIEGGLLENKSSSARKASKPKFESTPRSDPASKPDGPPPMPVDLLLEPTTITTKASAVRAIAASPWAPLLAITSQHQVLLHHSETLELLGILPFPEGDPVTLTFTPDSRYLIVGGGVPGKSGTTITFDVTNGSRLLTVAKEFDTILAADIRPGYDLIATGGPSRLLKIWKTDTGAPIKSIKKHTDWITALDISPDGVLLASGDRNGGVWVWESESGSEFHTLRAHQAAITATVFRADSNILATTSEDGTLRFWEMNGGSEVKKIDAHPGGITAFSFARDGTSLTTGRDAKARLWKTDFSAARDLASNLPALPTACALDATATRAFIGDTRGTVLVIDTHDGKTLGEIPTNPPTIEARLRENQTQISTLGPNPDPQKLAPLTLSRKKWSAAAINTQLLAARHLAETAATETEEKILSFTEASQKVTTQAETLNRKRDERQHFAATPPPTGSSPEALAEHLATTAALDAAIARELEVFQTTTATLEQHHHAIDPSARLASSKKSETATLQQAYRKALTD